MTLALQDAAMAGLWLIVSASIVASAHRLGRQLYPLQTLSSEILAATVLAVGAIHFSLLTVGALNLFSKWPALLMTMAVSLLFWIVERRVKSMKLAKDAPREISSESDAVREEPSARISNCWPVVMWWIGTSVFVGHVISNGLLSFPEDWDTLMYHLPFIDFWIQSGSLTTMQSARWSTPATGELLGAWFVLPFSGDFLASLTNLPIFLLVASGAIDAARRLGLTGTWPHWVAFACLATHVTFRQSVDVSNDLAVTAFFLSGLAFALRYYDDNRLASACLFGVCFGLLCGVKYFALGYAVVLLWAWGLLALSTAFHPANTDSDSFLASPYTANFCVMLKHQLGAATLAVLSGGYWYLRNWWKTGYPLYPKGSADMSQRILYEDLSKTTLLGNGDPAIPGLLIEAVWLKAGPLHLIAMAALPAMIIVCSVAFVWQARLKQGHTWLKSNAFVHSVFMSSVVGCACVWVITPMLVEDQPGTLNHLRWGYGPVRYGVTFLSMVVIGLLTTIRQATHHLNHRIQLSVIWMFGGVVVIQFAVLVTRTVRFDLVTAALLGANLGLMLLLLRLLSTRVQISKLISLPIILLSLSSAVHFFSVRWHDGFARHFDRYDKTTAYSAMRNDTHRMIVLSNRVYPFLGARRQNTIFQPMLYFDVDAVAAACKTLDADTVATRIDNHKILSRYRPAWEELSEDSRFDAITSSSRRLKLFRFKATTTAPNRADP